MPSHPQPASRRLIVSLAVLIFACAASSAAAAKVSRATSAKPAPARLAPTGRLLVTVQKGAVPIARSRAIGAVGVTTDGWQVPEVGLVSVKPTDGQSLADTAAQLRALPGVKSVDVEHRLAPRFVPNDPALVTPETAPGTPAGTTQAWWLARENLFAAWDITRGAGAKVAIIDSGIDGGHPEFAGKISAAMDLETPQYDTGPANFDRNGHGTHVSSLACASGNNAIGIVGTGLDCSLIVAKSDFTDGSIVAALVQSTDLGADAINMSFGGVGPAQTPAIVNALQYAFTKGVVLVAAAANEPIEEQSEPANVLQPTGTGPDINFNRGLSVTSADHNGARTSFAGRGTQISIAAFGHFSNTVGPDGVLGAFPSNSTVIDEGIPDGPDLGLEPDVPPCLCRAVLAGDARYGYISGTSMATPEVAGIAALVGNLNPDLTAYDKVKLLKQTATRVAGTGWNAELGWGIVNGGQALAVARIFDKARPKSKLRRLRRVQRRTRLTLRWTGADVQRPGLIPSGIKRYELFRSVNGRGYKRIAKTTKRRKQIRVHHRSRYRYYVVAIDNFGNREKKPTRADVSFRVR